MDVKYMTDSAGKWSTFGFGGPLYRVVDKENSRLTKKAAERMADYLRSVCPVGNVKRYAWATYGEWSGRKPGSLKESIKVKEMPWGWDVRVGGHKTFYWTFLEWGAPRHAIFADPARHPERIRPLPKRRMFRNEFEKRKRALGALITK